MSSAGSARQARRRSRVAVVSLVATASLVGTYLGALRPQSTYAATGRGAVETQNGIAPPLDPTPTPTPTPTLSGCEDIPGEKTYVDDDTKLQAAVASSVDDSIICITGTEGFRLSKTLVLDDTSITLMGDDSSISLLPAPDGDDTSLRHLYVDFSDASTAGLVIRSLTFTGEYTVDGSGGAIYVKGGVDNALVVYDSVFENNIAYLDGGAIRLHGSPYLEVYGSVFTSNVADDGGAIHGHGDIDITDSIFTSNIASDDGGAIFGDNDVNVTDSHFTSNIAGGEGGAIEAASGDVYVTNSLFTTNTAVYGGAIYAFYIEVKNGSSFLGNRAIRDENGEGGRGGALHTDEDGEGLNLDESLFQGNSAESQGGALFLAEDSSDIETSTFLDNRVTSGDDTARGGAIYALDGDLDVEESYFSNNFASSGGGLWVSKSIGNSEIINSAFVGNDASGFGAGLYAKSDDSAWIRIKGSSFVRNGDNTAPQSGGGLSVIGDSTESFITSSTVWGNRAKFRGAGMSWNNERSASSPENILQLSYLTVVDNELLEGNPASPKNWGAGILFEKGDPPVYLVNSIVYGNTVNDDTFNDIGFATARNGITLAENLFTSDTSWVAGSYSNLIVGDPLLGELEDSGGPRIGAGGAYYLPTARPAWNSPVIVENSLTTRLPVPYDVDQLGAQRGSPAVLGAVLNSARPPSPTPVIPPSAPLTVSGAAGDGVATITWSAPASSGSFPVSTFQAVVSPGGQSCLVASSPCMITGLTNGTEYTVRVRALSGAGWGAFSNSSVPFTPQAAAVEKTMVITGSRGEVRGRPGIIISGSSTGMVGEQVAPWVKFPGQSGYAEGSARPTIDAQGDFTWQRRTGKKVYVYFRSLDSDVKSNRVIIAAR